MTMQQPMVIEVTRCLRTLRLKVKAESYTWLNAAAVEVNQVWNWGNETSAKAARPFAGPAKWLSGFDLDKLSAGAAECFETYRRRDDSARERGACHPSPAVQENAAALAGEPGREALTRLGALQGGAAEAQGSLAALRR